MRFQHVLDRLPESLGDLIARHFEWQPLYKDVAICIDDSDDSALIGRQLQGTVRAHGSGRRRTRPAIRHDRARDASHFREGREASRARVSSHPRALSRRVDHETLDVMRHHRCAVLDALERLRGAERRRMHKQRPHGRRQLCTGERGADAIVDAGAEREMS
jgi:hypothetical protein